MRAAAPSLVTRRFALPVGCFALAVATISIATEHAEPPTTYGSVSTFAYVADLAATLTLLTAGAASALFRPRGSVAALATGVGVTWLASDWVGWSLGWPVARSVAMLIAPLTVPLLFHLIAAYPTGKLSSSRDRLLTVTAYAAVGTASLVHAAVYDPFRQVDCWTNCTTNVFLVQSRPGMAEWSTSTSLVLTIATAAAAALVGARRLAAATSVVRGATWFVVIPAVAVELAFASYAVLLLTGPSEDPQRSSYRWHFLVRATLLVCLGLGILWGVFRARRTEWALHRLVDDLGGSTRPGSLRDVLALQLGDDDLTVAYWLPSNGTFVDADGVPTDPVPAWNQASTRIMRGGETLAVVVHDESLTGQREIGAAARLAVDNERRQAEILAQLREVRESQVRIVAAADATRQALERDIHDGTQHRLLAAFYELRLARNATHDNPRRRATFVLELASAETQLALVELRDAAHGIFPPILADAGLDPALRSLAERSPVPIEFAHLTTARFPNQIESAAYLVVAAAAEDAGRRGVEWVAVDIREHDGCLVVDATCRGDPGAPAVGMNVHDRIGAAGGRIVTSARGIRAELPCVS